MLDHNLNIQGAAQAKLQDLERTGDRSAEALTTPWTESVSPDTVWNEYPRPHFVRPGWTSLNGVWDYAITDTDEIPSDYDGEIVVPFPVESRLSGVERPLLPGQWLWYRRVVDFGSARPGDRTLLHFEAVDAEAVIYVNGVIAGEHTGGYQRFTLDVTDIIAVAGNEVIVRVADLTDYSPNPQGKQTLKPVFVYYTASSGIWQSVWWERVPSTSLRGVSTEADLRAGTVEVAIDTAGDLCEHRFEVIIRDGNRVVGKAESGAPNLVVRLDEVRLWSPDDPILHDVELRLSSVTGVLLDEVRSYIGFRTISMRPGPKGNARVYLNDIEIFQLGVVDQGYWPDGLYTAPTDAALLFDVQAVKAMGFNTVRKHLKVESERWYYHCDREGLLVWQDMPTGANDDAQSRNAFEREVGENIRQLRHHPSVITWVLFNEGWGAYDVERLSRHVRELDPGRLLDAHSGPYDDVSLAEWFHEFEDISSRPDRTELLEAAQETQWEHRDDWRGGHIADSHFYPGPKMGPQMSGLVQVAGEHGSFGCFVEGHVWDDLAAVGRGIGASGLNLRQLRTRYAASIRQQVELRSAGLAGSFYFQLYDVEQEQQGLITYDRRRTKIPLADLRVLHSLLVPRSHSREPALESLKLEAAPSSSELDRHRLEVDAFRRGQVSDGSQLRRMARAAIRAGTSEAQDLVAAYLAREHRPFSESTWRFIAASVNLPSDVGFALLQSDGADLALGRMAVQEILEAAIARAEIDPLLSMNDNVNWVDLNARLVETYGPLGARAAVGAQMIDARHRGSWTEFGTAFALYYRTPGTSGRWSVTHLAECVADRVDDAAAIEVALDLIAGDLQVIEDGPKMRSGDPRKMRVQVSLREKSATGTSPAGGDREKE